MIKKILWWWQWQWQVDILNQMMTWKILMMMTRTMTSWYIELRHERIGCHWSPLQSFQPARNALPNALSALCCTKLQCNAMPAIHFQMLSVHQSTILCPKNHFLIFWIASYCTLIHFTAQNRILLQLLHWIEKHWSELHRTKLHFYNNNKLHWTELHFIVVCTIQQQLHYAVLGFLTRPLKFTHLWYKVTSSGVGKLFFFVEEKKILSPLLCIF